MGMRRVSAKDYVRILMERMWVEIRGYLG